MRELRYVGVCFFCGNSISKNAPENGLIILEKKVSERWKDECADVLNGLLCSSGSVKGVRDIFRDAGSCEDCDIRVKDLCCTFQMMDKLRNRMAEIVERIVQNLVIHHEQVEVQSGGKRVTGSVRVLKKALEDIVKDFELSGWPVKTQEEIRACIFYNLADIEIPQVMPTSEEKKDEKKVEKKVNISQKLNKIESQESEEIVVKSELPDVLEECDGEDAFDMEFSTDNDTEDLLEGNEDDFESEKDDGDDFVPSEDEEEADDDNDESLRRFPKRRRLVRENVSYQESDEEDGGKKKTAKKKNRSKSSPQHSRRYRDPEKQKRKDEFHARCPFVCPVITCRKRFSLEMLRDGHFQKIHEGNPKPFKCPLCDKCFVKTYRMNVHIDGVHKGQKRLPKLTTFQCKICSEMCANQERLECHIGAKHPRVQVDHTCEICGKGFKTEEEVAGHKERIHVGETPFKCEDCGMVFPNSVNLRNHTKTIHPVDESALCKICNRTVTSWAHLKIHNKKNHPELFGIKYDCQYCKENFRTFHILSNHLRKTHPEKMPGKSEFPCGTCGEKFRRSEELSAHIRKHTGEKPYDCKLCGKKFRTIRDTKIHEQRHSGVKVMCDFCGRTFSNGASFRKHVKLERKKAALGESIIVRNRNPSDSTKKKRIRKPRTKKRVEGVSEVPKDLQPLEQSADSLNENTGKEYELAGTLTNDTLGIDKYDNSGQT